MIGNNYLTTTPNDVKDYLAPQEKYPYIPLTKQKTPSSPISGETTNKSAGISSNPFNAGNSDNGSQSGTAMSELSLSEAAKSMSTMQSLVGQAALSYAMPMGTKSLMNMMAENDMAAATTAAMSGLSAEEFSNEVDQMSEADMSEVGAAIGGSTGMSAGQVSAAGENAEMGMTPGQAVASSLGIGVGPAQGTPSIGVAPPSAPTGNQPGTQSPSDPQPAATGVVADGQGDGSNDTNGDCVIVSELFRQKKLPEKIYKSGPRYGRRLNKETVKSYHMWGKPLVRLMRRSNAVTWAVRLLADPWAIHIAYTMGATEKNSRFGHIIMVVGLCGCRVITAVRKFFTRQQDILVREK